MSQNCNFTVRIVVGALLAAGLVACTEKSSNPLSPNVAGPMEGIEITVPPLMEPIEGVLVRAGNAVVLRFGRVDSNSERPVWYQLQVAEDDQFTRLVHEADDIGAARGASNTADRGGLDTGDTVSYRVPTTLEPDSTYWWHVRAVDGANIGPYSASHAFELFTPVGVGVPQLRAPIGGRVTNNRRPSFAVDLPEITGPATRVTLEIEIARDAGFKELATRLTKSTDGESVTVTPSQFAWERTFYWRARITARGREGDVVGDWSKTASFRTPPQPAPEPPPPPPPPPTPAPSPSPSPNPSPPPPPPTGGGGGGGGFRPGGSPNAPFTTNGGNPPNMLHIVNQVAQQYPNALRNSCQSHGGSWEFMDRVVERLRAIDGRWGYNCKRGNCGDVSHDVVDYYRGQGNPNGSTNVAIIDIIVGHCGPNPGAAWIDQTNATRAAGTIGRWKYPR